MIIVNSIRLITLHTITQKAIILQADKEKEMDVRIIGIAWPENSTSWDQKDCSNLVNTIHQKLITMGYTNIIYNKNELMTGNFN